MEPETYHNNIQERVTEAIQSGRVRMHSSLYFAIRTFLLALGTIGVFVLSTVIVNFIFFSIERNAHHKLLGFGLDGWVTFLAVFPWALLVLDLMFIFGVLYLLRTFRVGYKTPLMYLTTVAVAAIVVAGVLVEQHGRPFNARMVEGLRSGYMPPPFPMLMRGMHGNTVQGGMCLCEVVSLDQNGVLVARDTRTDRVLLLRFAHSPYATTTGIAAGDIVFVAGRPDGDGDADDVIDVFGLTKIGDEERWVVHVK